MKKHPVSRFVAGIYFSALFILTSLEAALLFGSVPPYDFTHYFLVVTTGIGIVLYLHLFVTDISMAKFSFDEEGITMYVGFRKKKHRWSEFMCAGIVAVNLGVKSRTPSDTFWVYFAETNLTEKEKIRFLSKTRRDLNRIAYFQYSESIFNQIMGIVPEKLRRDLTWDRETVVGEMRFWEKVYNK